MAHYIDAERLKAEIKHLKIDVYDEAHQFDIGARAGLTFLESFIDSLQQEKPDCHTVEEWMQHIKNSDQLTKDIFSKGPYDVLYDALNHPYQHCYDAIKEFGELCFQTGVNSVKQEQPDNLVQTAKVFLDELSRTPYNNTPITEAQIIIKQLILFFENPASYEPNAINQGKPNKESLNESQQEFVNIVTERMLKEGPIPTLKGKQKVEFEKEFNRFKQITGMINFPAYMEVYKKVILWFMAWGADNLPNLNKATDSDELDSPQEQPEVDIEKEVEKYLLDNADFVTKSTSKEMVNTLARHFAEWGRKQVLQEIYEGKVKPVDKITAAWLDDE